MSVKMMFLTGTLVVAGIIADTGMIAVRVHEKKPDGTNLRLYVPAIIVPIGMKFVPDEQLEKAVAHAKDFLPAMRVAAHELEQIPDGPLVEVVSPKEKVSVVKSGGSLIVDVDSTEETVHVSVPLEMMEKLARDLDARAARQRSNRETQRD